MASAGAEISAYGWRNCCKASTNGAASASESFSFTEPSAWVSTRARHMASQEGPQIISNWESSERTYEVKSSYDANRSGLSVGAGSASSPDVTRSAQS